MASTASRASTRAEASAAFASISASAPLERTLPLGEGRLLLGQLRRGLRPVAIRGLELAELGRDLLLARGRSRLGSEKLGLQVGEPLLLCRGRFGALRQLLLALLELRLLGGDLRCASVDLRRAQRQALCVGEAFLEPSLQVGELVARLAFACDRRGQARPGASSSPSQARRSGSPTYSAATTTGDFRRRRLGTLACNRPLRGVRVLFGLRLFLVAPPLELAPETGPETLLGLAGS